MLRHEVINRVLCHSHLTAQSAIKGGLVKCHTSAIAEGSLRVYVAAMRSSTLCEPHSVTGIAWHAIQQFEQYTFKSHQIVCYSGERDDVTVVPDLLDIGC